MKQLFKGKKVLVTGGCGFIGSHIVRELCSLGSKVVVVDNLSTGSLSNIEDVRRQVEFHKVDINEKQKLQKIFKKIDFVSHQAALRSVPLSMKYPRKFIETNIIGTLNLLELSAANKVKVFVSASSSSVYGERRIFPEKEKDAVYPVSFYAMSKLSAENICSIYRRYYNVFTVSLRYFNVYGPYQNLESQYAMVIPKFITCFIKGMPCPVYGDGRQARDFTFIDDVVRANILSFVKKKSWGKVFNIGGGCPQSILSIYRILKKISGKDVGIKFLPPRMGDVHKTFAALENARRFLGFTPRVSFNEGLQRTYAWFKNNSWFWDRTSRFPERKGREGQ